MPHRIRLRGPWEYEPARRAFTRRFHQPTGLTATTQVWLVMEEVNSEAIVELNDKTFGEIASGCSARFEITAHLKPHNLLSVTVSRRNSNAEEAAALQPGPQELPHRPIGLISLEIE